MCFFYLRGKTNCSLFVVDFKPTPYIDRFWWVKVLESERSISVGIVPTKLPDT